MAHVSEAGSIQVGKLGEKWSRNVAQGRKEELIDNFDCAHGYNAVEYIDWGDG
jgi:hypothetical protein